MKQTYFHEINKILSYQIADRSFKIEVSKDVFPPSDWAKKVMESLSVKKGDRIIDIGTGAGVIGIYAALQGGEVYATDISPEAIEQTKKNAHLNGVSLRCSVGEFFAGFESPFDIIAVNLPQEIVPGDYPISKKLLSTVEGGKKDNEILLEFLRQAPKYMHDNSKIITPVCSLSFYLETFKYLSQSYKVRLLDVFSIKAKEFVPGFIETYQSLHAAGHINLFNRNGQWHYSLYIVELEKRNNAGL